MPKIVISLTSYPDRINIVHQVIDSLFRQKEQADEIILWLSVMEFPNKYDDLPESLNCLIGKKGFRVEWVNENIKSHKKYFYALQDNKNITITVDDDMYYSDTMVSTLMDSYRKHPYAVSARNVHIITRKRDKIAPYLTWEGNVNEYIGMERMDLCAIGVNGILYPPKCSRGSWFDSACIMENAEDQDDLWLKFNEIIDKVPVVYTGIREKDQVIEGSQNNPLYIKNAHGGENDVSICKLIQNLKKHYENIYQSWFEGLMTIEEFWSKKRKFYNNQLTNIIIRQKGKNLYICGAGKYAHILYDFIRSCDKEKNITGFLITRNSDNGCSDDEIDIKITKDLKEMEEFTVICGVGEGYREELKKALEVFRFHEWVDIDLLGIEKLLKWEREKL